MKIGSIPRKETPTKQPPILPLVLEEVDKEQRTYVSHSLRTIPTDADSPTYKMHTLVMEGTETVREIIGHPDNIKKVLTGLNVTTIANKLTITRTLLKGNALTQFNASVLKVTTDYWNSRILDAATDADTQTIHTNGVEHADNYRNEDFDRYLQGMVAKLVPAKALAKVKRHLRRNCRKPVDMGVRTYFQNLYRINEQEIPKLPPFDEEAKFRDDEFIDIITYGTPKAWSKEMDRQGFDPMDKSVEEVVTFMEQLEGADEFDKDATKSDKKAKKAGKSSKQGKGSSEKKELKYCEVHGECGHSTSECRVAKRSKKSDGKDSSNGKSHNKTWKRKADDNATNSQKEVAMLVRKMVRKELKSADKKRKSSSDNSDEDLCNIDQLLEGGNLDNFNYDEMDKMNITSDGDNSDGEVSV